MSENELFTIDDDGDEEIEKEIADVSLVKKKKKKKGVNFPASILDDPEIHELMEKAALKPDFDQKPVEEILIKSKRRLKKDRKAQRSQTKGADWFDMPATELTEENKMDLELLQLRNSLDPNIHYRKNDRSVLPKYFQVGKIVDNQADFYSSRMTKKERKRTMVEELMQDYSLLSKHKKKYDQIRTKKAKAKRGVGFLKKGQASKNKRRQAKKG
uniref:Fcf2 pre-rRNA processing C-terminal domain-containing protein n=1 Tax=Panagrolaimus superbus TaxID=310955 RepID=A0A914Y371_9BILA